MATGALYLQIRNCCGATSQSLCAGTTISKRERAQITK